MDDTARIEALEAMRAAADHEGVTAAFEQSMQQVPDPVPSASVEKMQASVDAYLSALKSKECPPHDPPSHP
ncbi:hypothetical protein [Phenylobacterium sp.]|uniref:hypothetical protein n=1 Tax=Phenylobacterium sp. TaxID=1871053 RepID=UPI0030027BB1